MLTRPIFIESHRMNPFTTRGTDVDVVIDHDCPHKKNRHCQRQNNL
jgi:hypothetical protein